MPSLRWNIPIPLLIRENWKQVAIGNTAGDPAPLNDGIRLGAGLIIRDKAGIDAIQSGKDEISIGYSMNLIPVQGAAYDFRTDGPMPVNHIAATETGRAGPEVRVFDQEGTMTTPNTGLNEETLAAIGAMVSKAVTDALPKPEAPGQTVSAQNIDPDAIAKSVMAGMKPVMDSLGEVAKGMADAQQKQDEETARKNAQDAADKLIANTLGEERARVAVLDQARNFIPAEKLESLREAPVKDILVAAVGDSVTDAANQSEEVLRGALMVMASQNQGRQDVANLRQSTGIVGDAVRKGNAYDQYVKSMTDAWKTPINANTGS